MYALDLFSGIGGNSIGLRNYVQTLAYCEADRHAQAVLLSRMSDGSLPRSPICTDVTKLDGRDFAGKVDIIIAGFPCQDISVAGTGAGLAGKRSGLFFEVMRLAKEIKPTFVFLENVPAIRTRGLDTVIQELTEAGYDCRWTMLSAAEIGAPHKRERWFCLARRSMPNTNKQHDQPDTSSLGNTPCQGQQQERGNGPNHLGPDWKSGQTFPNAWETDAGILRVANGIPLRMDRIKRLGNAVVPLQAKTAFEILLFGSYLA